MILQAWCFSLLSQFLDRDIRIHGFQLNELTAAVQFVRGADLIVILILLIGIGLEV